VSVRWGLNFFILYEQTGFSMYCDFTRMYKRDRSFRYNTPSDGPLRKEGVFREGVKRVIHKKLGTPLFWKVVRDSSF